MANSLRLARRWKRMKRRIRRLIRKRATEIALGLAILEDDIEVVNAIRGQEELLRLAREDSRYAWLARRLKGKEVRLYSTWR